MPIQALLADLDGTDPVTRTRFTPKALVCYTNNCEGDSDNHNGANGETGTSLFLGFANDLGEYYFANQSFENPLIFIFALGNSGAGHSEGSSSLGFGAVQSWDQCGITWDGTYDNIRVGGWVLGGDELITRIGSLTLDVDGSPSTATFDLDGNEPTVVILVRGVDAGGAGSDCVGGLGVSDGTDEWFEGYWVDVIKPAAGAFSHDQWTETHDNACAAISDPNGSDPSRLYTMTKAADQFTLTAIGGAAAVPADATNVDYGYIAIYDPAGQFQIGVENVAGDGVVSVAAGFGRPDALITSRVGRELAVLEHATEIPSPPGYSGVTSTIPIWGIGSNDRFAAAYGFTGETDTSALIGLRVDEATGDGVYGIIEAGFAILVTVVGGVLATAIDTGVATVTPGDVVTMICDGDDVDILVNAVSVASGTQTDIAGPGRLFLAGPAYREARCGTIGTPPLIDSFNRPDNLDVDTNWQPAINPLAGGGGTNMSVAHNQMVSADRGVIDGDQDQASYWDAASFTDVEAQVIIGDPVYYDDEHHVWGEYAQFWSGGTIAEQRVMGGHPVTEAYGSGDPTALMPINHDYISTTDDDYPTGPFLSLDGDRASGWGMTTTGFAASANADAGNHRLGYIIGKLGPTTTTTVCGFPERSQSHPQIYRRL